MLHPLAALPVNQGEKKTFKLVSCIYDIPSMTDAGRLDRRIFLKGWSRLHNADVVWSSDIHKAELAREFGKLSSTPLVCHNTPPEDYLPEPAWPRDAWLRNELRKLGASIGEKDGCILLRAGAVGESGGIEETLEAMCNLPKNLVFLMMGRPGQAYEKQLLRRIDTLGLAGRAFLWNRPADETWKKALRGADIGHLIHGPFPSGAPSRLHALNSSLSNNRLFQYMAAGLPIVSYEDPRLESLYNEIRCFRNVRLTNLQSDLQNVLSELTTDSDLRHGLGLAGRAAHRSEYNWDMQFGKVLRAATKADTLVQGS
jgi:glycosyltransferase involved in cell wall biosynthesis